MSGVEAAGLVLGAIPLILASLEFYAKGIAVSKRYLRFGQAFKSLLTELRAENVILTNTLNLLLKGIVKQQDMAEFLAEPSGERWKDAKFDRRLQKRLGNSYDTYMAMIEELNRSAEAFRQKLKLDASWKPQFHFDEERTFKKYYKRLEFSLKKSDYDQTMTAFRQANQTLLHMTTQTVSLDSSQEPNKSKEYPIPNFSVINDRALGFHTALQAGWQCSCHSNHRVNLRLEHRMHGEESDESDEEENMKEPFHVVFRYSHSIQVDDVESDQDTLRDESVTPDPWSWEEADIRITVDRQPETVAVSRAKGVRFASKAKKAVEAALSPTPNLKPINSLCAAIATFKQPERDVCISLLADEYAKQKYGMLIYPCKDPPRDTAGWAVSSLRTILSERSFSRHDRLHLAVTLASSVLQLYETPWLNNRWEKDDILFINRSGATAYGHPFVTQSIENVGERTTGSQEPPGWEYVVRNRPLYALGICLIELCFREPLLALSQPKDYGGTVAQTEFNTANRLIGERADIGEIANEAGKKYAEAVARCIRCDFKQPSSNLEDASFQQAVYQDVVVKLKETYDFIVTR